MPTLLQKNRAYFQECHPQAATVLDGPLDPLVWLEEKPGGWNLRWEAGGMYLSDDPVTEAKQRLQAYLAAPLTYLPESDFTAAEQLGKDELDFLREIQTFGTRMDELDRAWPGEAFHFVHYGIGLAYELREVIDTVPVRHVYAIEPHFEVFRLACRVVDWKAIFDRAAERGVEIHLFLGGADLREVSSWLHTALLNILPGAFGNICFFPSYPVHAFERFVRDCYETAVYSLRGWGFIEDELAFITNAAQNLTQNRPSGFVCWPNGLASEDVTVVICGSGPSLPRSFDWLRQIKGRAVIFSCGTALRALLRAGITPDVHIELERVAMTAEGLKSLADEGLPLHEITLICSLTADPLMPGLFSETFYFLRANAVVHMVAGDQLPPIYSCTPFADHAAEGVALSMGARRIIYAGIDLGSDDPAVHHAAGSVYESYDAFINEQHLPEVRAQNEFPLTAPGNFGGTVYTNDRFVWGRVEHERTIGYVRDYGGNCVRFYNASHGVLVEGAEPLADPLALLGEARLGTWVAGALDRLRQNQLSPAKVADEIETIGRVLSTRVVSEMLREGMKMAMAKSPHRFIDILGATEKAYHAALALDRRVQPLLRGAVNHPLVLFQEERARRPAAERDAFDRFFADRIARQAVRWEDRLTGALTGQVLPILRRS